MSIASRASLVEFSRLGLLRGAGAVPSSRLAEFGDQPAVRQGRLQPILRAQPPDSGDQIVLKLPGEFRFHGAGFLAERGAARRASALRALTPVAILEAHDVVFTEIRARLHLDDLERHRARVLDAMLHADRDVG